METNAIQLSQLQYEILDKVSSDITIVAIMFILGYFGLKIAKEIK